MVMATYFFIGGLLTGFFLKVTVTYRIQINKKMSRAVCSSCYENLRLKKIPDCHICGNKLSPNNKHKIFL